MLYIKSELTSLQRNFSDSTVQNLSKSIHEQLDKQPQIFYILRLILNENYLSQQKKKLDFNDLNLEDVLNTYIGKNRINLKDFHSSIYFKIIVNKNLGRKSVHLYSII